MAKDIKQITEQLEKGVKEVFESERYQDYLSFMAKFHNYSVNNSLLIYLQMPTASLVAGYQTWLKKFGRQVKKGEKGLTIFAPMPREYKLETEDEDGNKKEKVVKYTAFRATTVFDISQTDGEDVPSICDELTNDVADYSAMLEKIIATAPVPVGFEDIEGGSLGYYSFVDKRIAIKEGMGQLQTIKTLLHEIAHAILHEKENGEQKDATKQAKEVQAESVAYTVCAMLGLETSGYSFEYVAGWASGKEAKELSSSMEVIRKTANSIYEMVRAA